VAEPFLSEIRIFSFNFPPKSWAFCNGQFLPINQNQALFSLLGTTYGGNGQTTFALPNLQGRVPIHQGSGHTLGETAGSTAVTVNVQQMPEHVHLFMANSGVGTTNQPANAVLSKAPANTYAPPSQLVALLPNASLATGGSQPHDNMEPYLVLNFCIALQGIFPSQN
jgi:microcystin-dependent protein